MIKAVLLNIAEVVGSNPTRFIFINLVKYGIKLSLFLMVVEQNPYISEPNIHSMLSYFSFPTIYQKLCLSAFGVFLIFFICLGS